MQMEPVTPSLPNIITLNVGGRVFRTTKAVLSTSPYFANLFERWEDHADLQADGSLFVDADPDIFPHVLNYMRRPQTFPLYWTRNDGFDYVLYSRLSAEADYFMLLGLGTWIQNKTYLDAVKVRLDTYEHPQVQKYSTVEEYYENEDPGADFLMDQFLADSSFTTFVVRRGLLEACPADRHQVQHEGCMEDVKCTQARTKDPFMQHAPKPKRNEDVLVSTRTCFEFHPSVLVNEGDA